MDSKHSAGGMARPDHFQRVGSLSSTEVLDPPGLRAVRIERSGPESRKLNAQGVALPVLQSSEESFEKLLKHYSAYPGARQSGTKREGVTLMIPVKEGVLTIVLRERSESTMIDRRLNGRTDSK